jgi:hypothetical protein
MDVLIDKKVQNYNEVFCNGIYMMCVNWV